MGSLVTYKAVPTAAMFHADNSFARGIMGPIGSGKSVACCIEIMLRAMGQAPDREGVRRTRWAVIRNTYPQLRSTTIKTWTAWFDKSVCTMRYGAPIDGQIRFAMPDGTRVEAEVFFLSLDRADQLGKLLSLELTGSWINEAREINKVIIDGVSSRVGRYPDRKSGAEITWSGFFMDTNPPDDDHWWYAFAEHGAWRVDNPMPSVDEIKASVPKEYVNQLIESLHNLDDRRGEMDWRFFRQPGALLKVGEHYVPNPQAENVKNQPLGYMYWYRLIPGKDPDWIKVYVLGEYGSLFTGRPVYQGVWADAIHMAKEPLRVYPGLPLRMGWDFGLTPACSVGQLSPHGQLRILREFICDRGGIREFSSEVVRPALLNQFPGIAWATGCGDPAGNQASQVDEVTCIGELNRLGFTTEAAVTNDFLPRRQAVISRLTRMAGGEPGLIVDPSCKTLRKGFNGGYQFARIQASGDERYRDVPSKNMYSHVHDSLQYLCLSVDESYSQNAPGRTLEARQSSRGWGGI